MMMESLTSLLLKNHLESMARTMIASENAHIAAVCCVAGVLSGEMAPQRSPPRIQTMASEIVRSIFSFKKQCPKIAVSTGLSVSIGFTRLRLNRAIAVELPAFPSAEQATPSHHRPFLKMSAMNLNGWRTCGWMLNFVMPDLERMLPNAKQTEAPSVSIKNNILAILSVYFQSSLYTQ